MAQLFLGGDFRYFWPENIGNFAHFPFAWDNILNTGIGQSQIGSLWITSYLNFTAFFSKLGLSWNLISLIFWILPAILLSFFTSFFLFKYLFKDKIRYSFLAGIIYAFNTYFLMVLTGGQLGVALSYSLSPLVFLTFIQIIKKQTFKSALISGLILGLQLIFDPRMVYVTLVAVFLYLAFNFTKKNLIKNSYLIILSFIVSILINSYWILPLLLFKYSPIPGGFGSVKGFEFFSFSDFSHSLSLLHPNWPENIFGKIYFLNPAFLILPIIAFSSLLFNKNKNVLFFAFLAFVGVFLAKGANQPLGQINVWLFQNLPGMVMFRDPTKWYLLIALSYSILIPYALKKISEYFRFAVILFVLYFIYLINPVFGQIKIYQVPQEYVQLKNFLDSQKTFSRTLWVPEWQRFGYFSNNHPAIGREELFKGDAQKQITQVRNLDTEKNLKDLSVKYIIVPYDSQGEIFSKGRKYDHSGYLKTIQELRKIEWLKEINHFGKIKVFEVSSPKDHFWSPEGNVGISYSFINPAKYKIQLQNVKKGDVLVFSESFDKYWTLKSQISNLPGLDKRSGAGKSQKYNGLFNSFLLPKDGSYELTIYYTPQDWVNFGVKISAASLIVILVLLGLKFKKW